MNEIERLLRKELYSRSFYDFVKDFWSYADPSKFQDSELIQFYCETFQYMARSWSKYQEVNVDLKDLDGKIIDIRENKSHLNLVVPPRHSKSMVFNVLGPIWLWTLYPIKAVSISHTGALASQMNSKRHKVINSTYFRAIFKDIILISNTTSSLKDSRGGELYSLNRNAFTGYGGDVIINDDLTNAETARKDQAEMENTWSYYRNTMPSRINDIKKCIIMNIQQRLAPNDITGHILNDSHLKEQYIFITLPAIFKEKTHLIFPITGKIKTFNVGDTLWPERFGNYDTLRYQVGQSVFETQYLQNPVASDKSIVKESLIIEKSPNEVPSENDAEIVYASHDFPIKEKETSDYMGSVLGYKVNQTIYIKDCLEKRMAFVKSIEYVTFLNERFPGIIQIIEDKANGTPIIQQLQDKVPGIQAYNPKSNSKTQRLESSTLYMESKNVVFVKDQWNEDSQTWELSDNLKNLKQRLLNFPYVKYDDIVDAFSMLVLYVFMERRNNVYVRSFNSENVVSIVPENLNSNWFVNREGNQFKVSKIGVDYVSNSIYLLDEWEFKGNVSSFIVEISKHIEKLTYMVDTSNIPLNNYSSNIIFDPIQVVTFNDSVNQLDLMFSNKKVKILKSCKRTIGEIENFKWLINKDEDIRYVTEKDGFIRNLRVGIKSFGLY